MPADGVTTYGDITAVPGGFVATGGRLVGDDDNEAFAQRFDLQGTPIGTAVSLVAPHPYSWVSIDSDSNGRFVTAWQNGFPGGVGNTGVFGRRFDTDGTPLGDIFQVDGYTTEDAAYPDVAVAADGSFLLIWQGGVAPHVYAQRYATDGQPSGTVFQASETDNALRPAAAALADGSFIVTWVNGFTPHTKMWARRVLPDALEEQAPIADNPANSKHPKVTAFRDGFVASWTAYVDALHGDIDTDIWAGPFDASGNTLASNTPISTGLTDVRPRSDNPEVAADGEGFVVVWDSATYYDLYPGDGIFGYLGPSRLNAARMNADGARTDEFDIGIDEDAPAHEPKVAMHKDGTFMVVWSNYSRVFCDTADRTLGCGVTRCASFPRSSSGADVTIADALAVLRAATGAGACLTCVCDVDASGDVAAADALRVLQRSIGLDVELACTPC